MNWNDDRLDRLANQVDAVGGQVEALRQHMDERFARQEARIQERFERQDIRIQERFEKQDARIVDRFDKLQNSLIITLGGILAAFGSAVLAVAL